MIQFRFGLTPLDQVRPWGRERPKLHWFGLTDGWYGIDLGDHELLRYTERTVRALRGDGDGSAPHPYTDYFVVRLWEDMIALLSAAMEPVPDDLVGFVAGNPLQWSWEETPEAEAAAQWHGDRTLNMTYLRIAPYIRWWRTVAGGNDSMTVTWEHAADPENEIEYAAPAAGRVTMPTAAFLAAVTALDHALLAAMEQRVGELEAAGAPTGVELDLEQLRRDQQDRATWLRRAQERERITDWDAVRAGARLLHASADGVTADG